MKRKLHVKDWKPVRHGNIYCSPSCGGGCTHAAYMEAQLEAERLARRLGKGFKPRVWENLGWHYSVVSIDNSIKIYPSNGGGYSGLFGAPEGPGGDYVVRDTSLKRLLAGGLKQAAKLADEAVRMRDSIARAVQGG